jgi:ribose transport system ATP-binding protein
MDELLTPILEAKGIRKEFPGVLALDDVDLTVLAGEVHCLVGQNGAGKSTLVKIITGAISPDAGQLRVAGHDVEFRSPRDSLRAGISCIFQELDLVPSLSVAENLLLADLPGRLGLVDASQRDEMAKGLLARVGATFPVSTLIEHLSVADRQLVAIAKALAVDAKVVLMDEPSAPLSANELDRLFDVIGQLKRAGCGVLYISHRLEELHRVGSIATVLRDGRRAGTYPLPSTPLSQIVAAMIGGEATPSGGHKAVSEAGPPMLDVSRVAVAGACEIRGVQVWPGEIVGLAGLVGSGRTTFLRALFGADRAEVDAKLGGAPFRPRHPSDAIRQGVGLVPEDRRLQGLMTDASVADNLVLPSLPGLSRYGLVAPRRLLAFAVRLIKTLAIKVTSPRIRAGALSGGNQQRVVLGKWMGGRMRLLLLDEPTRGIDVGAKAELFGELRRIASEGVAMVVASSELDELLPYCDRILVFFAGRLVDEFPPGEHNKHAIVNAMVTGQTMARASA